MGCMASKSKTLAVCPLCGYFDREPENPQRLWPRTILEGKYVIGRALGQGGFGITYLACDLEFNHKLAVKEYFPLQNATRAQDRLTVSPISTKSRQDLDYGLGKFAEEAKALSHFKDHPGVVNIVDFFYANGTAYIVMKYVEGRDLKEYLNQRGGKISYEAALKILLLVMTALEDVHSFGIVHRDISPDNIYVEEKGGGVKILDFGATRYAMGEQSRSLSVVLKPGYAPEEQYRSRGKQGPWTDIYALGATFYRAITGKVPPEATDRMEEDDLQPPSSLGVAIPASAEAGLMKALAVKAVNRFQTVAEFREAMMPQRITPQVVPVVKPVPVPPPPVPPRHGIARDKTVVSAAHLPKVFLLVALAIVALILLVTTGNGENNLGWRLLALVIQFGLMMFVFGKMWKSIQDGHARTSPDNAVAYCFIPLFNLYWAFPVLWGFAKDYNAFLERHARAGKRLNQNIFLTASIAYVAAWVVNPIVSFLDNGAPVAALMILLNACFLLPVVAMICDAVNALGVGQLRQSMAAGKLFRLCGVAGEYEGETVDVNSEGMIIGRSPAHANIVLSSDEVSGRHVRVWRDAANAGVWIEDMKSTNGTFYRQRKSGGQSADWVRVEGSKLLFVGDRFRLSGGGAEFEVEAA